MKKILFVSSEAVPYVKTGGLADVVGSLPKYFDKKEYDVRVVIPKYACMDRSFLPNFKIFVPFLCKSELAQAVMLEFSSQNIMVFTFILWTMNFISQENLHTTISMKMWKSLHIFQGSTC